MQNGQLIIDTGIYNPWQNLECFQIVRDHFITNLKTMCDLHNVPSDRDYLIAINYYPPNDNMNAMYPSMPYHTDFGLINCLTSDGPTAIMDNLVTETWCQTNLSGTHQMFQCGGALNMIDPEYNALPHGVGAAPIIETIDGVQLGKVSIVGVVDPLGPMTLYNDNDDHVTLDAHDYIRTRFCGMFGNFSNVKVYMAYSSLKNQIITLYYRIYGELSQTMYTNILKELDNFGIDQTIENCQMIHNTLLNDLEELFSDLNDENDRIKYDELVKTFNELVNLKKDQIIYDSFFKKLDTFTKPTTVTLPHIEIESLVYL